MYIFGGNGWLDLPTLKSVAVLGYVACYVAYFVASE